MSQVLIVFQANHEAVEQLALAVAVGAVEGNALIRLRRLSAPGAPEIGHKSYGRLTAADLSWADVIVVGLEDTVPNLRDLGTLIDLLKDLAADGGFPAPKLGLTFSADGVDAPGTAAQLFVQEHLTSAGLLSLAIPGTAVSNLNERMKLVGQTAANVTIVKL